jgi:hypothetical protein
MSCSAATRRHASFISITPALEAQLHREFGGVPAEFMPVFPTAPDRVPARGRGVAFPRWLRYAAAAAIAVCATWLALHWRESGRTLRMVAASRESEAWVATVLFAENCQWKKPGVVSEGEGWPRRLCIS